MSRPALTWKIKEQCLLFRSIITCALCGVELFPEDEIEYDHVHELADRGPHEYQNVRPVHALCHIKKSAKSATHRAHIARLESRRLGTKKPKRKKAWPSKPIPSRPFPKGIIYISPLTGPEE